MPVFTSKYMYLRCTRNKYSCRYHVPADNTNALCYFLSPNYVLLPMRWPLLLCSPSSRLFTSNQKSNICYWGSRENSFTLLGPGSVWLYPLTEGWYRCFVILPVPRTGSFNSVAEALIIQSRLLIIMLSVFLMNFGELRVFAQSCKVRLK